MLIVLIIELKMVSTFLAHTQFKLIVTNKEHCNNQTHDIVWCEVQLYFNSCGKLPSCLYNGNLL